MQAKRVLTADLPLSVKPDSKNKRTPSLAEVMRTIRAKAFVILDGTLLTIDRIAADAPYYSGGHKRHGMNVQVLTGPFERLLWASRRCPARLTT